MRNAEQDFAGSLEELTCFESSESGMRETQTEREPSVVRYTRRVRKAVERTLNDTGDCGLTQNIVREALQNVLSGREKTVKSKGVKTMSGTNEIRKISDSNNSNTENAIVPYTGSDEPLTSIDQANLEAMSLLTSSAKHLHVLMKKVTGPVAGDDANTMRLPEVDRVNAAANCGKQIYSLMRLQLDAIKLTRRIDQ